MNRVVGVIIVLVMAVLAFVLVRERAKTKLAEGRAADLELAARSAEAQAKANEEIAELKEHELRRAQSEASEQRFRVAAANRTNASVSANRVEANRFDGPLIKDAETRALMRKQQLEGMRKQVDRFVSTNLIARLSLSLEEAPAFKELIMKKHSGAAEFMASMIAGELEGDALSQAGRQVKERFLGAEREIEEFLGPARYGTFIEEEKTQETRLRIKALADELKKGPHAFSGTQQEQLFATMIEERRHFPFADGFGDPMRIDFENFHDHFSDANLDRYLADVQAFNERVRQRAAAFLTSDQIEQIKTAQQNHLEQAKVTVKLTNALFSKRRAN